MNDNRIASEKKGFKVNGITIWFDFGDQIFINNLFQLIMTFDKKPDFADGTDVHAVSENLKKMSDFLKDFHNLLEELFGPGTCEKIFGCKMPTIDRIAEFVEIIVPMIQECYEAKEENQKRLLEKYGNRAQRRMIRRK